MPLTLTVVLFPPRLETLTIGWLRAETIFPSTLRHLCMSGFINVGTPKLSPNLEQLRIVNKDGLPPDIFAKCTKLKSLTLLHSAHQRMKDLTLPPNLETFAFSGEEDQLSEIVSWPASLTALNLACTFSDPSERMTWHIGRLSWPDTLVSLDMGTYFLKSNGDTLFPRTLEILKLGCVDLSSTDFILSLKNLRVLTMRSAYWDRSEFTSVVSKLLKHKPSLTINDMYGTVSE